MSSTEIMLRCHTGTRFSKFWFAETICEKWMQNYEYKIAMEMNGFWNNFILKTSNFF